MEKLTHLQAAEDLIFSRLGDQLRIATPLGLGKPNQLLNRIYQRAKKDPSKKLTFFTALSLDIPEPKTDLERRFVEPFYKRHFGENYPRLDYLRDLHANEVPANITIHEFYFQAGSLLRNAHAQRNYISLNYTHVPQSIHDLGINAIVQLIAKSSDGKRYSLSCNPDLTLDVRDLYKKNNKPLLVVGVVHPSLPFLGGDAEVEPEFFDAVVDSSEVQHKLFAVPRAPVEEADHMIGLHASRLICDGGTLQIGIGSLSDALVASTLLRQRNNIDYRTMVESFDKEFHKGHKIDLYDQPFKEGLYGTSEMLMDGFMHLRDSGVLKRLIFDQDEKAQRYLHGAFFLGSKDFYQWLSSLEGDDFAGLSMTRVSKVNDLYDEHEFALRKQRKKARFFNTCMQVSLLGAAASETLPDGSVVSGVGGQYNFVAMSHELPDSHSILMLKSTRLSHGKRTSNIVWSQGHLTIPRHLRDVVITEYGIAHLKGQSDEECIKRLLMIADSAFQDELLQTAQKFGKVSTDWVLPEKARRNTPRRVHEFVSHYQAKGFFSRFPLGSDFSEDEQRLQTALMTLKEMSPLQLFKTLMAGRKVSLEKYSVELQRMRLQTPQSLQERVFQRILVGVLTQLSGRN